MSAELVHLATRIHPTHGQTWAVFATCEQPACAAEDRTETFSGVLVPECTRDVVSAYLAARIAARPWAGGGDREIGELLSRPHSPRKGDDPRAWTYVAGVHAHPGTAVLPLGASPAPVVAWEYHDTRLAVPERVERYPMVRGAMQALPDGEFADIVRSARRDADEFNREHFRQIGADGWELVTVADGVAYFKRPAQKAAP